MAENKNFHKVDGVLYDKPVKEGTSKKGEPYSIPSIVLEIDDSWQDKNGKYHEGSSLVEFRLSKNVVSFLDSFSTRDAITVEFKLGGRKYKDRYYNEPLCYRISHADLDAKRDSNQGNIPATPKVPKQDVAIPPPDDDDMDSLPF